MKPSDACEADASKQAKPRILFAIVFGPFARDDEFGSRAINPMELYHNQVTRVQGPFSLRMFHRSRGLLQRPQNVSPIWTPRIVEFSTKPVPFGRIRYCMNGCT